VCWEGRWAQLSWRVAIVINWRKIYFFVKHIRNTTVYHCQVFYIVMLRNVGRNMNFAVIVNDRCSVSSEKIERLVNMTQQIFVGYPPASAGPSGTICPSRLEMATLSWYESFLLEISAPFREELCRLSQFLEWEGWSDYESYVGSVVFTGSSSKNGACDFKRQHWAKDEKLQPLHSGKECKPYLRVDLLVSFWTV
jgi:hypothetical protein